MPPPRLREGNIEIPVPLLNVLPFIEASSALGARLRESSLFTEPFYLEWLSLLNLFVLPVLEIDCSCYERLFY